MTRPALAAALAALAAVASIAPAARAAPSVAPVASPEPPAAYGIFGPHPRRAPRPHATVAALAQAAATVPPLPPDLPAPSDAGTAAESPSPSPSPSKAARAAVPRVRAHATPRPRPTPTASPAADAATSPVQPGAGGPPAFSDQQPSVLLTVPPYAVPPHAAPSSTAPTVPPDTATAEPRPAVTAPAEPTPIPTQAPTPRPLAPYQPTVPESLADPNVRGIIARPIRQLSQFGWLEGTWRAKGTQEVGGVNTALSPTTYVFAKVLGGRWIFGADGAGSGYLYVTYDPFASRWVLMRFQRNPSYGIWFSQAGWRGNRIDFTTTYSYANGREYLRRLQLIRKDPRTFGLYEEEQLPDGSFAADDAIEFTRQ